MIPEAEVRRLAALWQADPMILDLDYSLSWFLAALAATPDASQKLRFKGGTCLRKCYFPGYRFSEDLDFTANSYITPDDLTGWVEQTVDITSLDVSLLEKRRGAYELDWKRRLDYLVPDSDAVSFEEAWQSTIDVISQLQGLVR